MQRLTRRGASLRAQYQRLAIGTCIFPRPMGLKRRDVKLFPARRARSGDEIHTVWYLYLCVQVESFPFEL